jgi:hypothetical protein
MKDITLISSTYLLLQFPAVSATIIILLFISVGVYLLYSLTCEECASCNSHSVEHPQAVRM